MQIVLVSGSPYLAGCGMNENARNLNLDGLVSFVCNCSLHVRVVRCVPPLRATLRTRGKKNAALLSRQGIGESLERVTGIEPAYRAWEASVLPLNYTRLMLHFTVFCLLPVIDLSG